MLFALVNCISIQTVKKTRSKMTGKNAIDKKNASSQAVLWM